VLFGHSVLPAPNLTKRFGNVLVIHSCSPALA
jgi:hypothetical protein